MSGCWRWTFKRFFVRAPIAWGKQRRARKGWAQRVSCWSPWAGVLWRGLKSLTVVNKNVTVHMYVYTSLGACLHVEVCGLYTFWTLKSAWWGGGRGGVLLHLWVSTQNTAWTRAGDFYLGLGRKSTLKPMAPGDQVKFFFSSSSCQGHD